MAAGLLLRWLCARNPVRRREARLVLWGGERRAAEPGRVAGEVMMEHAAAGHVVCRADGFRVGRPAPVLAVEDQLEGGCTYLVVPVDRLPQGRDAVVTAASLAALCYAKQQGKCAASKSPSLLAGGSRSPFEYVKGEDGRTVIRVTEEFMVKAVTGGGGTRSSRGGGGCPNNDGNSNGDVEAGVLCSTPELRKHYEQLVGAAARGRSWSPRLDTIKERKGWRVVSPGRCSPVRLLGLGTALS